MATSPAAGEILSVEVKPDPEVDPKFAVSQANIVHATIKVKYEEPDDGKIDYSIPIADDSDDMFDDAEEEDDDGLVEDEIVDLTYEGLVHIQGVEHFVCRCMRII